MESKLKVFVPGFVFASLLNNAAKSGSFQDGLLLGEFNTLTVSTITDSQQGDSHEKEEVTVQQLLINDTVKCLYDNVGSVNKNLLSSLLASKRKQLIGWFSIRHNTNTSISIRERTFLQNLLKSKLYSHQKILFLLVTPTNEENKATHNFSYQALIVQHDCHPTSVKVNVINLGNDNHNHEYMHRSRLLGSKKEPTTLFIKQLQDTQADKFFTDAGSVSLVDNSFSLFYKTLNIMKTLKEDLSRCDETTCEVENEIEQLEKSLGIS